MDIAGWNGGFDVVLGNPPWEQMQFDPREFFASRRPEIAMAPHAAARERMITALQLTDPDLAQQYLFARRTDKAVQSFVHASGRFPLTAFGRLNSASLFAELSRSILSARGQIGLVLPIGIATDSFNQHFFSDLVDSQTIVNLYDFENRRGLFPAVHSSMKFCLITIGGREQLTVGGADFVFFAHQVSDIADEERRLKLSRH